MAGAVILARYSSIEEALVVQNFLNAHGMETHIDCGYHAQNDWLMVPALGSIGLLINAQDKSNALAMIKRGVSEAKDNLEHRWGELEPLPRSRNLIKKWSFPILYPVSLLLFLALAGLLSVLEYRRKQRLKDAQQ
ncbi:MAG: hypothetical protein AAGH90_04670 [Pseudomonadota bacterium]